MSRCVASGTYTRPGRKRCNVPDPKNQNQPPQDVVDADPDPTAVRIAQLEAEADEDAGFARAEAGFAAQEHQHAQELRKEGKIQEAVVYDDDARGRMEDASQVMEQANKETAEAERLREKEKEKLSLVLREMPNQGLATLRTAVSEVRLSVQNLSQADRLRVGLAAHLDEQRMEELREIVIIKGYAIEQALASGEHARKDAHHVIQDLVTFVAAVMTIADHLPPLLELVNRFGQLLLQFRL